QRAALFEFLQPERDDTRFPLGVRALVVVAVFAASQAENHFGSWRGIETFRQFRPARRIAEKEMTFVFVVEPTKLVAHERSEERIDKFDQSFPAAEVLG